MKDYTCKNCSLPLGHLHMDIFIGGANGLPVKAGFIEIKTDPFLVEDWMLQKTSEYAARKLTQFIVESNVGKVIN